MIKNIVIKEIKRAAFDEALSLVWTVFRDFEAPDYSQEGLDEFYQSIHDENYLSMLSMYGAYLDGRLVGVIATRSEGAHIALFFVDGAFHRQGIGKRLFETVLQHKPSGKLTVNSSPFAVPVYHKLGFSDTAEEQTMNGLRFTPMVYEN